MGTRNLSMVLLDGNLVLSKYCQWDGYPEGQGATFLNFLSHAFNKNIFIQKIKASKSPSDEEFKNLWIECGADPVSDMVSFETSDKFKQKYFHLHRDCGADVLNIIQSSDDGILLRNDFNFAADSLFCEWAYLLNLDNNTFEVYKGFNKSPLNEQDRFFNLQDNNSDYYPIKLVKSYSLDNLPSEQDFLKDFEVSDDE